jgi:tagatose-1,6-bisphosphate aldolase
MGYYSELRKMESAIKNSSYPNTTPFTLSVQNLRSALLTLDRVKNMDEVAVGLSLDRMSSALNELCKNEDENIVRACKNAPDGEVDRYFIGTLNFIEGAPEPVVEVNPEIIPDDEEAVDSEESEGGVAAVRSACAAAFGGNDGSQLLTSHLSSGKCAKELAANSEVAEQIGVQGIIEALQRWRSVARGKRRNLLMLEGIGIERLYQIGIVVHPGKNQADL